MSRLETLVEAHIGNLAGGCPRAGPEPLYNSGAILLETGKALLFGGCGSGYWPCASPAPLEGKLFDPETETWRTTAATHHPRFPAIRQAVILPSGRVLVVGGNTSFWIPTDEPWRVPPPRRR